MSDVLDDMDEWQLQICGEDAQQPFFDGDGDMPISGSPQVFAPPPTLLNGKQTYDMKHKQTNKKMTTQFYRHCTQACGA